MNLTLLPREPREVRPGAVHVPDWLSIDEQRQLVTSCREWMAGPVPARSPVLPTGNAMSVKSTSLGWHWQPYQYSRIAHDVNGERVAGLPDWLKLLAQRAVLKAYGDGQLASNYEPDAALINFYEGDAKMGMHQDKDEIVSHPVVSLSLGDACVFRFGNTENRNKPFTDVELLSGDLFVFGGASRFAYHGVTKVVADTGEPAIGLKHGRFNVTIRSLGITD